MPGSRTCAGPLLTICAANGESENTLDCSAYDQTCARGECVPPNECGNALCESGEFDTCEADCTEECGNDVCGPGETFTNCAADCPPECGDGSCNGGETPEVCPLDCLATCGDETCDAAEDRFSCPVDCGFCGDGICQDGFETPRSGETGALESCQADCLILLCEAPDDCFDGIDCTDNICGGDGACQYVANDDNCGALEVCLDRIGCCADADEDGFADIACGGSDCNDDDFATRPGAPEVCGGGDRNCNGVHRPAVSDDVVAFNDGLSDWHSAGYWETPHGLIIAWVEHDGIEHEAYYATYDFTAQSLVDPVLIDSWEAPIDEGYHAPRVTYSSNRDAFVVQYHHRPVTHGAFLNWFDRETGAALRENPIVVNDTWFTQTFASMDGTYAFGANGTGPTARPFNLFYTDAEASFSPSTRMAHAQRNAAIDMGDGRMITFSHAFSTLRGQIWNADGDVVASPGFGDVWAHAQPAWDGESFWFLDSNDGAVLRQFTIGGSEVSADAAPVLATTVGDLLHLRALDDMLIAIRGVGDTLQLHTYDYDRNEILAPGTITGGSNIHDAYVTTDGGDIHVFWIGNTDGIQRLFTTILDCE